MHAVAQTDTAHSIGLEESHQSSTFNGDRAAHAGATLQHRLCLVCEMKIFGCHIEYFGMSERVSDTNKKTNYIARPETTIQIY